VTKFKNWAVKVATKSLISKQISLIKVFFVNYLLKEMVKLKMEEGSFYFVNSSYLSGVNITGFGM
jgi:hypothetical protein